VVDASLHDEIAGDAVVRAQADAPVVVLVYQREQRIQIISICRLSNQDVEAARQLLSRFCHCCALMVTASACRCVCIERRAAECRRVAIQGPPAKGSHFGKHVRIAVDDAGKVHQFGQPMDRSFLKQRGQVFGRK